MFILCICSFLFFFFQAEDGIRDAQESRGLGDVYKRQGINAEYGEFSRVAMESPAPDTEYQHSSPDTELGATASSPIMSPLALDTWTGGPSIPGQIAQVLANETSKASAALIAARGKMCTLRSKYFPSSPPPSEATIGKKRQRPPRCLEDAELDLPPVTSLFTNGHGNPIFLAPRQDKGYDVRDELSCWEFSPTQEDMLAPGNFTLQEPVDDNGCFHGMLHLRI
eukprot:TRINITY_DN20729_c0_g1_i1.p1 TRINITY_DN20729_c0_g1~~TRINITY_DN20729_c0_g1_i1.p1  ORF type:complete len:224 (+),score=45.57 TRINITY_DN20729_c0_g1_i1:24-695(+)